MQIHTLSRIGRRYTGGDITYSSSFVATISPVTSSLMSGIVAYWKFDGNSTDSTGNSHNGTDANMTFTGSGILVSASYFNGSNSSVTIGNQIAQSLIVPWFPWTWAGWVKINTGAPTNGCIWGGGSSSLAINYSSDIGFGQRLNCAPQVAFGFNTTVVGITKNVWTHIAIQRKADKTFAAFINGNNVAIEAASGSCTATTSGQAFGVDNLGYGYNKFSGYQDEVGFWSKDLSPGEIAQLYNSGSGKTYPF